MDWLSDFEDFLEFIEIVEIIELAERVERRKRRRFRSRINHFQNWTEDEFFQKFRVSKKTAKNILDEIKLNISNVRIKVTPEDMVLFTLRYYACGSLPVSICDFRGIHKSTAAQIVYKVSCEIARLASKYIKMPSTDDELIEVSVNFYDKAKFPRCIGALDCTHVKIRSPAGDNSEAFRNKNGYYSINVQCVGDASLLIRNIVCRWPGSVHASTIWNNCNLKKQFENGQMSDKVLVADSRYDVSPYLITPILNPATTGERLFNEAQAKTRKPIETLIGVWKRRCPVLAKGIKFSLDRVDAVIVATAVVHNIACLNSDPSPPALDDELEKFITEMDNYPTNNSTRLKIVNYFSTMP